MTLKTTLIWYIWAGGLLSVVVMFRLRYGIVIVYSTVRVVGSVSVFIAIVIIDRCVQRDEHRNLFRFDIRSTYIWCVTVQVVLIAETVFGNGTLGANERPGDCATV